MDMMPLNGDLVMDILGRVDGTTLANAGCVCSEFWAIAREEIMWEEACRSLWPSTGAIDIKGLISSLGGFRRFYANCFPLIAYESKERGFVCKDMKTLSDESIELHTAGPSDFVSVVDVHYKNEVIYSKVVWGIPGADDFQGWFSNCPFRIDLINYSDAEDEDHTASDGLPTISMVLEKHKEDGKFLGHLMENIRLSWILINRKTREVANLSSWSPLVGQRHWPSDKDFVIRFGSILPAHNILPCEAVQCILVMKCRVSDGDPTASLKITELDMRLEDMMGAHVNGRKSLLILERALGCKRSMDHNQILESYQKYLSEQSELREAKMRSEGRLDTLCILSGIVAFASFWYVVFREGGAIF